MGLILSFLIGFAILYLLALIFLIPIKIVYKLLTNALVGGLILMAFNLFGDLIGLNININYISAILVGVLGIPGVILLLIFQNL